MTRRLMTVIVLTVALVVALPTVAAATRGSDNAPQSRTRTEEATGAEQEPASEDAVALRTRDQERLRVEECDSEECPQLRTRTESKVRVRVEESEEATQTRSEVAVRLRDAEDVDDSESVDSEPGGFAAFIELLLDWLGELLS